MTDSLSRDLEAALDSLRRLQRRSRPDRQHARALLIPLGRWIRENGGASSRDWLSRVREATAHLGGAWAGAIQDELSLACTEHVQSADPRFLILPNYDLEYALEARERLEARLITAQALGFDPPARLARGVRKADHLLEAHLANLGLSPSWSFPDDPLRERGKKD